MSIVKTMMKVVAVIIIIGIILALAGFIIGGVSFSDIKNGFISDEDYTLVEEIEDIGLTSIEIECDNNIISLSISEDESWHVSYYYADYYPVDYSVAGGKLSIKATFEPKFSLFRFKYPSATVRTIKVEMPIGYTGDIAIKTENGTVSLDSIQGITNISVQTSNGKINVLNSVVSENANLRSSNGEVKINNTTIVGELDVVTSNGKIISENLSASKVRARTSNGNISFNNISCNNIDCATSNGSNTLSVNGDYASYRIEVSTSNGQNEVNGLKISNQTINQSASNRIKLSTSNGSNTVSFN